MGGISSNVPFKLVLVYVEVGDDTVEELESARLRLNPPL